MALSNYERFEAAIGILYTVTAAVSIGALSGFTAFGFGILDVIETVGPFTLDIATAVSVLAILVAYIELGPGSAVTDISGMETGYQLAAGATIGLTAYGSIDPGFALGQSAVVQFLLLGVSVFGYWALAYN